MGAHRAACTNSPANGMLGITISNLSCHDKPSASAKRHAYSDYMPHNPAADSGQGTHAQYQAHLPMILISSLAMHELT